MGLLDFIKRNPAQPVIANERSSATRSNTRSVTTTQAFRGVEVVNRCVNMLVDSGSQVNFDIKNKYGFTPLARLPQGGLRKARLDELFNVRPNPYMDSSTFWRLVLMDFVMEGWAFIHWDGTSLYHIPAANMEVFADRRRLINRYIYDGRLNFNLMRLSLLKITPMIVATLLKY